MERTNPGRNEWMWCAKTSISRDFLRQAISKSMTAVEASSFPSLKGRVAELPSCIEGVAKLVKKHL
jgi:hypothetical protein